MARSNRGALASHSARWVTLPAWLVVGGDEPPAWEIGPTQIYEAAPTPIVRERYAHVRELTASAR